MKTAFKAILQKAAPKTSLKIRVYNSLVCNKNSFLHTSGWMRSYEESKPIDSTGEPIPWMNYAIVSFLRNTLKDDIRLFEFGSGYSTVFYATFVKAVTSVEHDQTWIHLVRDMVPRNVTLVHKEKDIDGGYCRAVTESGCKYDVVVVDGRDRINCVIQSLDTLSPRGVLLLDDSKRERYQPALDYALEMGFRRIDFEGLKPGWIDSHRTTVLYRHENCLGI